MPCAIALIGYGTIAGVGGRWGKCFENAARRLKCAPKKKPPRERLFSHLTLVEMLLGLVLYESGDTLATSIPHGFDRLAVVHHGRRFID